MRSKWVLPAPFIIIVLALSNFLPTAIHAEAFAGRNGFMLGLQSGYGHISFRSDQDKESASGAFSFGMQGGYAVSSKVVIGLQLGGWLIQPFDLLEANQGESVSNAALLVNIYPITKLPAYLTAAFGHASYSANQPEKQGGGAWGAWLLGGGYEFHASRRLFLATQLSYGRGRFSDIPEILGKVTGRRYEVADISLVLHWYSRK